MLTMRNKRHNRATSDNMLFFLTAVRIAARQTIKKRGKKKR